MRPRYGHCLAAGLATAAFASAMAQQPAPPPPAFAAPNLSPAGVRALAVNCTSCHGTEGRPTEGSSVARLAGRPAEQIIEKMKAFKDGKAEATVMHQIAKGYSDAEIVSLAAHFAALKP